MNHPARTDADIASFPANVGAVIILPTLKKVVPKTKKEVLDVAMRLYSALVAEQSVGTDNQAIDDNNAPPAALCDIEECNAIVL